MYHGALYHDTLIIVALLLMPHVISEAAASGFLLKLGFPQLNITVKLMVRSSEKSKFL